jgi:hypothetical protein
MADDRLSRFKNLERSRKEGATGPAPSTSDRFGSLGKDERYAPGAPTSPVAVERFAQAPSVAPIRTLDDLQRENDRPSGLELASSSADDQPFVRCSRCQSDNHSMAASCAQCGTDLNTPEQRSFNERLWEQRREEAKEEGEALAKRRQAEERAAAQRIGLNPPQQRQVAEQLAREVADETRARLDNHSLMGGWGFNRFALVPWLFQKLPPWARTAMLSAAIGIPTVLTLFRSTRPLGLGLMVVVGFLLLRAWLAS